MAFGKIHTDKAPAIGVPLAFWGTGWVGGLAWALWLFLHPRPIWMALWQSPSFLVAVHLFTLGWITPMMLGSLYQWIPVVTNRPWPRARLAVWIYAGYLLGAGAFLAGLSQETWRVAAAGGFLVAGSVLAFVTLAASTLVRRPLTVPLAFVASSLACLTLTVLMGCLMALALAGEGGLLQVLPWHMLLGLGGWFSLTLMGVSYKLLPMLAVTRRDPRWGWWSWALTLGFLFGLMGVASAVPLPTWVRWWGALALPWTVYAVDLYATVRSRRSHQPDVVVLGMAGSLLAGVAAPLLLAAGRGFLAATLFALGWLGLASLSYFQKILPFALWQYQFSRHKGSSVQVPHVAEILPPLWSRGVLGTYIVGGVAAVIGRLVDQEPLWRAGIGVVGLGLALAIVTLVAGFWRSQPHRAQGQSWGRLWGARSSAPSSDDTVWAGPPQSADPAPGGREKGDGANAAVGIRLRLW
ncbi:MAG: hypothetical protein K6U87_07255 [Firmicutes bacterium]|nr:hypothetical protein [Bacillota bacterium]